MKLCILFRKLSFLRHLLFPKKTSISTDVFNSLRNKDIEPLVVQQCQLLEMDFQTTFTDALLSGECCAIREIRAELLKRDRERLYRLVATHESFRLLSPDINWLRLWDAAREGLQGTRTIASVLRLISQPAFNDRSCHLCGSRFSCTPSPSPSPDILHHLNNNLDHLLTLLANPCIQTFELAASIHHIIYYHSQAS